MTTGQQIDSVQSIQGTVISPHNAMYPSLSPDWLTMVYSNGADGRKLYKKSASDDTVSAGTPITTVWAFFPQFSPDSLNIAYIVPGDAMMGEPSYIYKKSATDTLDGTAIETNDVGLNGLAYY